MAFIRHFWVLQRGHSKGQNSAIYRTGATWASKWPVLSAGPACLDDMLSRDQLLEMRDQAKTVVGRLTVGNWIPDREQKPTPSNSTQKP